MSIIKTTIAKNTIGTKTGTSHTTPIVIVDPNQPKIDTLHPEGPAIALVDKVEPLIATAKSDVDIALVWGSEDTLLGTKANDIFHVDNVHDKIAEGVGGGYDKVLSSVSNYRLPDNVEWLQFTTTPSAGVIGYGNASDNAIFGNNGKDILSGEAGNDLIFGNAGDDYLFGGLGNDSLYGGADNDYLAAHEGDDRVYGGTGNDTLLGGAGADELRGDDGKDELWGEAGADKLYGGGEADTFRYWKTTDSALNARDLIADFQKGSDRIDLHFLDADAKAAGDQGFHLCAEKPFFTSAGDLWIETTTGKDGSKLQTVYGDVQGDGVADFAIGVQGSAPLTAADFIL